MSNFKIGDFVCLKEAYVNYSVQREHLGMFLYAYPKPIGAHENETFVSFSSVFAHKTFWITDVMDLIGQTLIIVDVYKGSIALNYLFTLEPLGWMSDIQFERIQ
jgi:hypothetical protein